EKLFPNYLHRLKPLQSIRPDPMFSGKNRANSPHYIHSLFSQDHQNRRNLAVSLLTRLLPLRSILWMIHAISLGAVDCLKNGNKAAVVLPSLVVFYLSPMPLLIMTVFATFSFAAIFLADDNASIDRFSHIVNRQSGG